MLAEKIITQMPPDPTLNREQRRHLKKLRVAAYCRVSTDDEEQQNSYKAQIAYYTDTIESNPDWVMVGVFPDEGISGTDAKRRPEFQKLMELCRRGKVDMILTKSISRFARNTVDCLSYIRMLKELGVAVVFEKEGINTMEVTSELLISFMSAFAQAESESLSMNVTWGKRRSFQKGNVTFQYTRFYGYERGEDDQLKIIPEQAEVVQRIFNSYLAGQSVKKIKEALESENIPSSTGKAVWSVGVLQYMLRNEKYIGDAILQKTFVVDFMTKKIKKNNGEVPKYYISNSHEPIVDREIWNRVQEEIARRAGKRKVSQKATRTDRGKYSGKFALSERLVCGECGAHYRRCTWARGGVKRIVWRCINRLENGRTFCKDSPTIEENRIHAAVIEAFRSLSRDGESLIPTLREAVDYVTRTGKPTDDGIDVQTRVTELQAKMLTLIEESVGKDEAERNAAFKALSDEINALRNQQEAKGAAQADTENRCSRMNEMIAVLEGHNYTLDAYNDGLVRLMVKQIRVLEGGKVAVRFAELGAEYVCELRDGGAE